MGSYGGSNRYNILDCECINILGLQEVLCVSFQVVKDAAKFNVFRIEAYYKRGQKAVDYTIYEKRAASFGSVALSSRKLIVTTATGSDFRYKTIHLNAPYQKAICMLPLTLTKYKSWALAIGFTSFIVNNTRLVAKQ